VGVIGGKHVQALDDKCYWVVLSGSGETAVMALDEPVTHPNMPNSY
jgi:hypothetical protein